MSDFSTVELSPKLLLLPKTASVPSHNMYQSKDLPEDGELSCCVDASIDENGVLWRIDDRGSYTCPNFSWWIRLAPYFGGGDSLYIQFKDGKAIKAQFSDQEYETQRPDGVDSIWVKSET